MSVLLPGKVPELKITLQLPVPLIKEGMEQFVSAPVIFTVPVGSVEPPVTVTVTLTVSPGDDGSGESEVIVVMVGANCTLWFAVPLLVICVGVSGL
jgi:hypothetical protein